MRDLTEFMRMGSIVCVARIWRAEIQVITGWIPSVGERTIRTEDSFAFRIAGRCWLLGHIHAKENASCSSHT